MNEQSHNLVLTKIVATLGPSSGDVDAISKPEFEALDLKPFTFEKNGRKGTMSYHLAPASAVDNAEELCEWARKGHDAALRTQET